MLASLGPGERSSSNQARSLPHSKPPPRPNNIMAEEKVADDGELVDYDEGSDDEGAAAAAGGAGTGEEKK